MMDKAKAPMTPPNNPVINLTISKIKYEFARPYKNVLKVNPAYRKSTSWRFIDAHYTFPDQHNPWVQVFPERMIFEPIMEHMTQMDYVGVKVGDVNNSIVLAQSETVEVRSENALILTVDDRAVDVGEVVEIPVRVLNYEDIEGYQFALHFDPAMATFEEITFPEHSFLNEDWLGLSHVSQGLITTLWHEPYARNMAPGEILFNLRLRVHKNIKLSELLAIQEFPLSSEAYRENEEIVPVRLAIDGKILGVDFAVFQNIPNPFTEGTIIPVQVPEATTVVLEVYAYDGKLVHRQSKSVSAGYNEFLVSSDDLAQSGMYYYTIATDKFQGTRKMVLLE